MAKFSNMIGDIPEPKKEATRNYPSDDTVVKRKRKNRRVSLLTYDEIVNRLDEYCQRNDVSRAEVFEKVIGEFLDKNGV